MNPRALKLLGLLCWLAPACETETPPQPSVYASLTRSCAPFDGPAVTLYLSEHPIEGAVPAPPYDMISVYRGLDEVLGQSILVTTQVGSAVKCLSASDCRPYSGAVIKFGALRSDSTISVNYRIFLSAESELSGSLSPKLDPAPALFG